MKILKIYNNNIVAVMTDDQQAALITGNGIGFKNKVNDRITLQPDFHLFKLSHPGKDDIQTIIDKVDGDAIEVARKIFTKANEIVEYPLNDSLLLHLADHISFKIEMLNQGVHVPNLLMSEIIVFYPKEFLVGQYGVSLINDKYKVQLDDEEASYLALHILNASMGEQSSNVYKITEFIKEVTSIIAKSFKIQNLENYWEYERLITHLKFLGQRMINDSTPMTEILIEDGFLKIREKDLIYVSEILRQTNSICQHLFNRKLNENEQIYLSIHVLRIKQNIGE